MLADANAPQRETLCTDSADPINVIIKGVEDGSIGQVQGADKAWAACEARGWVYEMDISPRQVGLDLCNRDWTGCNISEALLLMSDIIFMGWSWPMTAHAKCLEIALGTRRLRT